MSEKLRNSALIAVLLAVGIAVPARAQMAPGVRAQGLAGAFTGVADDASAVYWNRCKLPRLLLKTDVLSAAAVL